MCSPIIAGQKVFIATTDDNVSLNTFICAFDFNSGKLLWKFRTANSVKNTIACENGIVVAQDASCNLYALDSESGKLLWKQSINLDSYPYLTEGLTVGKGWSMPESAPDYLPTTQKQDKRYGLTRTGNSGKVLLQHSLLPEMY